MTGQDLECPHCGATIEAAQGGTPEQCPECGVGLGAGSGGSAPGEKPTAPRTPRARMVRPEQLRPANASMALSGAIGGALLGAVIWGVITYLTYYEVGWIAWGIGLLVGGGCAWLGGRGQSMAVTCAVLALVSIFIGKLLGTQFVISGELNRIAEEQMTPATYEETRHDWTKFAELFEPVSDEQLSTYMVEHRFSEAPSAGMVTAGELASFRIDTAPYLRRMAAADPSMEEWRDLVVEEMRADVSLIQSVTDSLAALDLLFAFLGVSTAYGLVMASSRKEAMALNRAARTAEKGGQEGE